MTLTRKTPSISTTKAIKERQQSSIEEKSKLLRNVESAEPLNYIDVLSRIQIEELILSYRPTLLFVEHDRAFCNNVATKTIRFVKRHTHTH